MRAVLAAFGLHAAALGAAMTWGGLDASERAERDPPHRVAVSVVDPGDAAVSPTEPDPAEGAAVAAAGNAAATPERSTEACPPVAEEPEADALAALVPTDPDLPEEDPDLMEEEQPEAEEPEALDEEAPSAAQPPDASRPPDDERAPPVERAPSTNASEPTKVPAKRHAATPPRLPPADSGPTVGPASAENDDAPQGDPPNTRAQQDGVAAIDRADDPRPGTAPGTPDSVAGGASPQTPRATATAAGAAPTAAHKAAPVAAPVPVNALDLLRDSLPEVKKHPSKTRSDGSPGERKANGSGAQDEAPPVPDSPKDWVRWVHVPQGAYAGTPSADAPIGASNAAEVASAAPVTAPLDSPGGSETTPLADPFHPGLEKTQDEAVDAWGEKMSEQAAATPVAATNASEAPGEVPASAPETADAPAPPAGGGDGEAGTAALAVAGAAPAPKVAPAVSSDAPAPVLHDEHGSAEMALAEAAALASAPEAAAPATAAGGLSDAAADGPPAPVVTAHGVGDLASQLMPTSPVGATTAATTLALPGLRPADVPAEAPPEPDAVAEVPPDDKDPVPTEALTETPDDQGWGRTPEEAAPVPYEADEGTPGVAASDEGSAQTVMEHARAGQPAVSARETAQGRYVAELERVYVAAWYAEPIDPLVAVFATDREVTVTFYVHRSGKVDPPVITTSSGEPELDRAALAAVPKRFPAFPADLTSDGFYHKVTLRYRRGGGR